MAKSLSLRTQCTSIASASYATLRPHHLFAPSLISRHRSMTQQLQGRLLLQAPLSCASALPISRLRVGCANLAVESVVLPQPGGGRQDYRSVESMKVQQALDRAIPRECGRWGCGVLSLANRYMRSLAHCTRCTRIFFHAFRSTQNP